VDWGRGSNDNISQATSKGVAQVVQCLPGKHKTLHSNPVQQEIKGRGGEAWTRNMAQVVGHLLSSTPTVLPKKEKDQKEME
jgi:hypothetical protein